MNSLQSYFASQSNPPKGYGSIEAGLKVMAFRSSRMKYWAKQIGKGSYTDEVFAKAESDVLAEYGEPFDSCE